MLFLSLLLSLLGKLISRKPLCHNELQTRHPSEKCLNPSKKCLFPSEKCLGINEDPLHCCPLTDTMEGFLCMLGYPLFPSFSPSIPNVPSWVGNGELANTNALRAFSPIPQVSHILLIIIKWLSLSLLISFECRYYTQHARIIILSSKILGNWGEFPFPLVPQRYAGNSLSQSFGEVWECGHHSWGEEKPLPIRQSPSMSNLTKGLLRFLCGAG